MIFLTKDLRGNYAAFENSHDTPPYLSSKNGKYYDNSDFEKISCRTQSYCKQLEEKFGRELQNGEYAKIGGTIDI